MSSSEPAREQKGGLFEHMERRNILTALPEGGNGGVGRYECLRVGGIPPSARGLLWVKL